MRIDIAYLRDTDDYEFTFQDSLKDKATTFRVNRVDVDMFQAAAKAAADHCGHAEGWKLHCSTESDPPPP